MSKYLFGNDQDLWQYPNDKYLSFITPDSIIKIIIKNANKIFNLHDKVIWDPFAGIGTDSIRFSKICGKIISSEIDKETYQFLNVNMDIFKVYNAKTFNEDTLKIKFHAADIVYYDPPWGDTYIKDQPYTFNQEFKDLFLKLHSRYHIIAKIPYLCFDIEETVHDDNILSIYTFSKQKLKFIFINKCTESSNP
jgi:predicted RNA methylase